MLLISIICNNVDINVFSYEKKSFHITLYLFIEARRNKVTVTCITAASIFRTYSKTKNFQRLYLCHGFVDFHLVYIPTRCFPNLITIIHVCMYVCMYVYF